MDDVLEYARVPVMIQSYTKAQSYAKATGTPFDPKYTRRSVPYCGYFTNLRGSRWLEDE